MIFSVIFATYNRGEILNKTLDGLVRLEFDGEWEVLVCDNSKDESAKGIILSYKDKLPLKYFHQDKQGKNNALNLMVEQACGETFIFTDDDVIVSPDWLNKFYEGVSRWPQHNVFGGKVLPLWPEGESFSLSLPEEFCNTAYCIADWDIPEGEYSAGKVWGPNMAVRKSIFEEGVRFDPNIGPAAGNYVMGSETEFTLRLERNGHKAVYLPDVRVGHQIRKEQLRSEWLVGRAFRYGRSFPVNEEQVNSARLFGMPRYFVPILIRNYIHQIMTTDQQKKLNLAIKSAILKGQAKQINEHVSRSGGK